jgi:hypothetical protein
MRRSCERARGQPLTGKYQIVNITAGGKASVALGNMRPVVAATVRAAICDEFQFKLPETGYPNLPAKWVESPQHLIAAFFKLREAASGSGES